MTAPLQVQHADLLRCLEYPLDIPLLLRKRRLIREILQARSPRVKRRIAILGGSTTADVTSLLEIFLLRNGAAPEFYESEYGRFAEDALYENPVLERFDPE